MKIWAIVAGSALAAGLLPAAAHATPVDESFDSSNIYGVTGFILTPTAAVVPSGCLDLGAHYVRGTQVGDLVRVNQFGCPDIVIPHGNLGLLNHLEIGGAYRVVLNSPVPNHAYMNAKFRATGLKSPLQVAAGVQDATNNIDRTVYAVGTLHVGSLVHAKMLRSLQVGGGWRFSNGTGSMGGPVDAPFLNGSFRLGSLVQLMAEWNPQQDFTHNGFICAEGDVNAGARIALTKKHNVFLDVDGIGLDEHPTFATGLTFRACFGKKHKKSVGEGGGEEKSEPKSDQKVDASPSLFPAHQALGLSAHLASAAK